jgi:hypothetical protein
MPTLLTPGFELDDTRTVVTSLVLDVIDPPTETVAWLTTEEGAFDATFTVTVIAG